MKTALLLSVLSFLVGLTIITNARNRTAFDRTSFSVSDSDKFYELSAEYDPKKTGKVQDYLDDHLRQRGDASFKNTELDATLGLTDKTLFYIKSSPGKLYIKFDKRKNSDKAYARFRKLGEGLGALLTRK